MSNVTLSEHSVRRHTPPSLTKTHQTKHYMASSIEDTLMKLDKCHSVDYNNDEVKLIKSKIEAIVHDISTRIGASNPILSNTIVQCGSFYHSSKITAPDEFDFLLVLNKFSQPDVCSSQPFDDPEYPQLISLKIDYKKLDIEPESGFELEDDPRRRQVALAATIESDYRNSIRNCLPTLPFTDGISFTTSQKSIRVVEGDRKFLDCIRFSGPALTLFLNWKGVQYPNLNISVDMTYVVQVQGLPSYCNLEKRLPSEHPLVKAGLFAEVHHELFYTRMLDDTWRQTFTVLENKIISFWFKENESSNLCYRLLKIIRDILMPMDQLGEAILKTYVLKTAFLHECEQYPEARFWTKNEISRHLISIFQRLLAAFQTRFLPNYFTETQNALSYPFDSEPEVENSEEDNRFIASVHEATCKITKDVICLLENSSTDDQPLQHWFEPMSRTEISDPDISEHKQFLGL